MHHVINPHPNVLSADEDLWQTDLPVAVPQPLLQLPVVELVHVDVSVRHADAQVVEKVEDVAALLECGADPAEAGDVHDHFPSLGVELKCALYIESLGHAHITCGSRAIARNSVFGNSPKTLYS